tara:strand:- start:306 stop:974 length:669 start_codon:yes stop_codon:yes gene_type:complete
MALVKFKVAPLPNAPPEWDQQYMRQVIRVLETYFSQLDSNTPNYAQSYTADYFYGSGVYLTSTYGQFSSYTDQTAAAVDVAYAVTYDQSDFLDGVTLSSGSRLTVPDAGVYTVNYSIQFKNTTNGVQDIDIWLRKNGTDIPDTNSRFSIPARKSVGNPSHLIAVTPVMVELAANDYIEVMWHVTDIGVSIEHYPAVTYSAGVTPAIPATPSAFVQVEFVSLT